MDKYRMFKNYMYNDLGITKDDIKNWTKESCQETSLKYLMHETSEYDIRQFIKSSVEYEVEKILKEIITDAVVRDFMKNVTFSYNNTK